MKINNIDLTRTRNDEHFQFMQFVLALVKVKPQNAALAAAHSKDVSRKCVFARFGGCGTSRNLCRELRGGVGTLRGHRNPPASRLLSLRMSSPIFSRLTCA
jgi:hypothetical protein